jgi:hypothetical protein
MKKVKCINANKSCFLKQGEIYEVKELLYQETDIRGCDAYEIVSGELIGYIFGQDRFETIEQEV